MIILIHSSSICQSNQARVAGITGRPWQRSTGGSRRSTVKTPGCTTLTWLHPCLVQTEYLTHPCCWMISCTSMRTAMRSGTEFLSQSWHGFPVPDKPVPDGTVPYYLTVRAADHTDSGRHSSSVSF